MAKVTLTIQDNTPDTEVWVETSPNDPTTGTLQANSSTIITPSADNGPWTVSFTDQGLAGTIPAGATAATVALDVVNGATTVIVSSAPQLKNPSQFVVET